MRFIPELGVIGITTLVVFLLPPLNPKQPRVCPSCTDPAKFKSCHEKPGGCKYCASDCCKEGSDKCCCLHADYCKCIE